MRRLSAPFVFWGLLVVVPPALFLYLLYRADQLGRLWPFTLAAIYIWRMVEYIGPKFDDDHTPVGLHDHPAPVGPRIASPSPDPPAAIGGSASGAVESSGMLLYWAPWEAGDEPRPSLLLADHNGNLRGGFDIPDPVGILPMLSGCRALVQTGAGASYVVDGVKGTSIKLALSGQHYDTPVGGGRWGFFPPEHPPGKYPRPHALSALVDFETGAVTDLDDVYTAQFSPDGETLAVTTWPNRRGDDRIWLIPVKDPGRAREVAVGGGQKELFDFDGQRLLYVERDEDIKLLVVEDLAGNERKVAARVSAQINNSRPGLWGWFISGRPEIAIRFPNRFAVVDPSNWIPRELFSLSGSFEAVFHPPTWKGAVLQPFVDEANVDPTPTFVDFEVFSTRRLESDNGEPAQIVACANDATWIALVLGEDKDLRTSHAILYTATGEMSPLPALEAAPSDKRTVHFSANGRKVIIDVISDVGARRCTFLDLDRGTVTEFGVPSSDEMRMSVDGSWAAYTVARPTYGTLDWVLTIVELATGKAAFACPGSSPVWLAP